MAVPGANPAAAMQQISKELQDKFDESGMGSVEEFVDSLDDLVDKIKAGPAELMKSVEKKMGEFKDKIEKVTKDPSSLKPEGGGGLMVACGTMYAKSVATKLGEAANDSVKMGTQMAKLATDVTSPLKSVGDTLDGALQKMEDSVKALAKLPKLVSKEIEGKDSPDDVAKVDTAPMKKALNGGDFAQPLQSIMGLAAELTKVVDLIVGGSSSLDEFIKNIANKIKGAFDAPFPLCCLSGMQPQALKDLLALVEKLEAIDFSPIVNTLKKASEKIGSIKFDAVEKPMKAFKESATDLVDKLDNTVKAAKMSTGGGMPSGLPSVGGMV